MPEPRFEYDFPDHYRRPPDWFPKKKAFNTYVLFHLRAESVLRLVDIFFKLSIWHSNSGLEASISAVLN